MLTFAIIDLTAGVLRNGVMQWYQIFAKEVPQAGAPEIASHWGVLLCRLGIVGGFSGGMVSDKFFQSRRGPPAALLCGFMFLLCGGMAIFFIPRAPVHRVFRPCSSRWRLSDPLPDVRHGRR